MFQPHLNKCHQRTCYVQQVSLKSEHGDHHSCVQCVTTKVVYDVDGYLAGSPRPESSASFDRRTVLSSKRARVTVDPFMALLGLLSCPTLRAWSTCAHVHRRYAVLSLCKTILACNMPLRHTVRFLLWFCVAKSNGTSCAGHVSPRESFLPV